MYSLDKKNNLSREFIKKMNICKQNIYSNNYIWISQYILDGIDIISITEKFLQSETYYKLEKKSTSYELFEAFYLYKNNQSIGYKLARYLKHCVGILGSVGYFDEKNKFKIIFFTIKDIILELDGNGFFTWINKMCEIIC